MSFIVAVDGPAMKQTKGKANPQMLNKLFIEEMNK